MLSQGRPREEEILRDVRLDLLLVTPPTEKVRGS